MYTKLCSPNYCNAIGRSCNLQETDPIKKDLKKIKVTGTVSWDALPREIIMILTLHEFEAKVNPAKHMM